MNNCKEDYKQSARKKSFSKNDVNIRQSTVAEAAAPTSVFLWAL